LVIAEQTICKNIPANKQKDSNSKQIRYQLFWKEQCKHSILFVALHPRLRKEEYFEESGKSLA
jgi:hypothetical protein